MGDLKFNPPALDEALDELYTVISICSTQAARDSKLTIQRRLSAVVKILRDAARRLERVSDAANGKALDAERLRRVDPARHEQVRTELAETYVTKNRRNKLPTKLRYTIKQAERAGLLAPPKPGKQEGNWLRRPEEMLRKTCAVQLARLEYPEALLGAYAAEELEGV